MFEDIKVILYFSSFRADFSDQLRKIKIRHKHFDYDLFVIRQSACLVIKPIAVDNDAALFNCTRWIGRQTL